MSGFVVHFPDHAAEAVELPSGAALAEHLDATNSPLLFGCRTGICGTCLVRVTGEADVPDEDELEMLEVFAEDDPRARLACQLRCTGDVHVTPHPDAP